MQNISINLNHCCKYCLQEDEARFVRPTKIVPSAINDSSSVILVPVCPSHAADWWDDIDGEGIALERSIPEGPIPNEFLLAAVQAPEFIPEAPSVLLVELTQEFRQLVFKLSSVATDNRLNAVSQTFYRAKWQLGGLDTWAPEAEEGSYESPELHVSDCEFWFTASARHSDDAFESPRFPISSIAMLSVDVGGTRQTDGQSGRVTLQGGDEMLKALGRFLLKS